MNRALRGEVWMCVCTCVCRNVCLQEVTRWVGMCPRTQTEVDSDTRISALTCKHQDTQRQRHVYLVELSDICLKRNSWSWITDVNSETDANLQEGSFSSLQCYLDICVSVWSCVLSVCISVLVAAKVFLPPYVSSVYSFPPSASPCVYTPSTLCLEMDANPCLADFRKFML